MPWSPEQWLEAFPFLALILITLGIAVPLILRYMMAARRRAELMPFADRMNLTYYDEDILGLAKGYQCFDCLNKGTARRAYNVLTGEYDGLQLVMFDYEYTEESGDNKQTYRLSFAAINTDMWMRALLIRPERTMDHLAGIFGSEDIDFESGEFSRAFFVKSVDRKYAYDVVHPRMMDFLLANRGWWLQTFGPAVLVYNGDVMSVEQLGKAASFARSFLRLFPDYLVQSLRVAEKPMDLPGGMNAAF